MQRYRGIILSEPLDQYIRVFFLGTGSPPVSKIRHSIATLIYVNRQWLLFDIGPLRDAGHVADRPVQSGTRPSWTGSEPVSKTTGMLVVTGGAPKIARGQKLVVGEPRLSASLLVKFWLPEFFS